MKTSTQSKVLAQLFKEISSHGGVRTVAERSGISYRTIESWLYKGVNPPVNKVEKILDALDLQLTIIKKEKKEK